MATNANSEFLDKYRKIILAICLLVFNIKPVCNLFLAVLN